jgi:hypothetical protein
MGRFLYDITRQRIQVRAWISAVEETPGQSQPLESKLVPFLQDTNLVI